MREAATRAADALLHEQTLSARYDAVIRVFFFFFSTPYAWHDDGVIRCRHTMMIDGAPMRPAAQLRHFDTLIFGTLMPCRQAAVAIRLRLFSPNMFFALI